jgi:hypothetical protein
MIRNDGLPARWQNPYPLSKIKINDVKLENDNDIYNYFKLTQEEIDYIENEVK